ncbi:MAG: phosphotransferase family protein [Anaerolineae bacterium]|nr:phosphotransferase family protein [Anaerolineae bacterium]
MNTAENPLDQVSDRLMAYLRTELNNADISYDIPLTPIVGGYEASTYHFKLKNVPTEFSKPLVLRLFRAYANPNQAVSESAVQNALAAQGYPVPSVLSTGTDTTHLGGAFLIMDYMPGETMLAAADQDLPSMLGKAHAALHSIAPAPLLAALRAQGLEEQHYRFSGRLHWLAAKRTSLPWLEESIQWLIDNRPPEPDQLAICHGDFHPLNILVKDGTVTAVLDWPGFSIGDAIMDVAFTIVLCTIGAEVLLPTKNWVEVIPEYLEAYRSERSLDVTYLDHYRMLRCVMAFVDGAEGQEVWASPPALEWLTEHVHSISRVRVALPG